jgi:catechol 2,3-dioxygenase-like lactoylglutathione lyase family enzyme
VRIVHPMRIRRAMPVVRVEDPAAAREFYEGYLGFRLAMEQDGMLMLASRSVPTTQLIVAWPSVSAFDPDVLAVDVSVEVVDPDFALAEARERGLEVVRELRDEPWGVRRFFVRDPQGVVISVLAHG